MECMSVNNQSFRVVRLLGHGKGGYSYLVTDEKSCYVLKQIHHEPCSYYQFGNKIEAEMRDYERLKQTGIKMPAMLAVDTGQERILKEYIHGRTVFELVLGNAMRAEYMTQIRRMCNLAYLNHINIDYFPTNFIVQNGELYYIDYECNDYMEEWNFENWGIKYWSRTPEFLQYVREHEKLSIDKKA